MIHIIAIHSMSLNFGRVVCSLCGLIRFRAPTWFLLLLCWSTRYGSHSSWYLIVSLMFTAKPIKTMFFKSVECHEKTNWLSPDLFNCCLILTLLLIPHGGVEAPNTIKHHLMRMDGTIQLLGLTSCNCNMWFGWITCDVYVNLIRMKVIEKKSFPNK